MSSENTGLKQSGRFQPGQSGNPLGRPRGARNATTMAVEALLDGQAEKLTQKAIQMALEGDMAAMKICIDRISPPPKSHSVSFPLRAISSARDAADALADVAVAVATGELTPAEGDAVSNILGRAAKAFDIADGAFDAKRIEQCSDNELYQIIARAREREAPPNLLTHERR